VILVGEMRDLETAEIALEAAETGHLVLSTLHTIDASKTIDRVIGLYPKNEERIIRTRLAQTFRYIISQRLIPRADGKGRIAAVEVLKSNPRTREYIEKGESEGKTLLDAIRDGEIDGMQDFDTVIRKMIESKVISYEDGLSFATNQNNLLLQLRGLASTEDYANGGKAEAFTVGTAPPPAAAKRPNSVLDMIE
jgi:twitching motility protein PilT